MYEKRDVRLIILGIALVAAVLIAVFFVLVRPAVKGYVVYKEVASSNQSIDDYTKGIDELKAMLQKSEDDLSDCNTDNSEFFKKLDELLAKTAECENKRGALESQLTSEKASFDLKMGTLQSELQKVKDELQSLKDQKNQLNVQQKSDYDTLTQNLANNLCCKERVDNPAISHYRVENHKIVCLESGTQKISCP